jgi:4-amino-4-deoxy-L-arabinose transferase-like glycosyltransferase
MPVKPAARTPEPRNPRTPFSGPGFLLLLFGIAFALRVLFLLESKGQSYRFLTRHTVDAGYFWTMAQQLAHTGFTWPEAYFMPPLYPYLLGLVDFVFGAHPFVVVFVQVLLGSGSGVLVYLLALRLFNKRVALWSFVGYLLCGNVLFLDTVFLPNAFTVFGELLVLYLLSADGLRLTAHGQPKPQAASDKPGASGERSDTASAAILRAQRSRKHGDTARTAILRFGIVGIILGLLALIRAETLLFLPLLLILVVVGRTRRSVNSRRPRSGKSEGQPVKETPKPLDLSTFRPFDFLWILLGTAVVIAPVFLHNLIVARDPTLISYNGGLNLYLGNNPKADGTWQPSYPLVQTGSVTIETLKRNSLIRDSTLMKPAESSTYWTHEALAFVKANPGRFLWLVARKLELFANSYEIPNNYYYDLARDRSLFLKLAFLPFGLVLALGLAGMILRIANCGVRAEESGFYLFFLVYLAAGVLIFTVSRLREPAVPLLVIFGSYFVIQASQEWRKPKVLILSVIALAVFAASFVGPANRAQYALEGHVQAGNIYLAAGVPGAARDEFALAAHLKPDDLVATYGLFNSAAKLKNRADAEHWSAELYRLSRTPGDSVYAFLSTGLMGTMTGDFPRARDSYLRALQYDPDNFDTHYLLALVYYTLKDLPNARVQIEQALSLDPYDQQALMVRSQLQQARP